MLRFLREKAHVIGLTIVITFGVTMFAGSFFLGDFNSNTEAGSAVNLENAIAVIGNKEVPRQSIAMNLNTIASQVNLSETGGRLSPEMLEIIQYNALMQAVNNMILIEGAKEADIKVDKFDLEQALATVYKENDVKDKKALKILLEEQGVEYKSYINLLRNDILVRKFAQYLQDQVEVTDQNVEDMFTEYNVQHIVIQKENSDNVEQAQELANSVYLKLQEGLDFTEAVNLYSDDGLGKKDKGELGWFRLGRYAPEIESKVIELELNAVAAPIESPFGFHIVKLIGKRPVDKPEDFDLAKQKQRLLTERKQVAVERFLEEEVAERGLTIQDPFFKAYESKVNGDVQAAIAAYNQQISTNPYNVVSHYLLAQLYLLTQNQDKALDELKKAEVKAELSESVQLPEIHVLMGRVFKEKKQNADALKQYDKAFELAKENKFVLERLKEELESLKQKARVQKINKAIADIDKKLAEEQTQDNKS